MKSIFMSALATLALVAFLSSQTSEAAITCGAVTTKAAQCVMFATGKAPKPTPGCCAGLQQLAQMVQNSVADKRAACQCLRSSGQNLGIVDRYLKQLPSMCKINVGFPVSTTTNCATIH